MLLATFAAFMLLFVAVGNLAARVGRSSGADYLLAGRKSKWISIGLSAGAVGCSGFVMTGAVGAGYVFGLSAALFPLAFLVGDYLFWRICAARLNAASRELNSFTVPGFLAARVHAEPSAAVRVRRFAALITIGFVILYASAQLLAAGKVVSVPLGVSESSGIWLTVALVISYCAVGGLRSSMSVHLVQSLMILLTVFGAFAVGLVLAGGPAHVAHVLRMSAPHLLRLEWPQGLWVGCATLLGFMIAGFTHVLSTPQILVRLFSGRSPHDAARAMWLYILITEGAWLCMTLFGMTLHVLLPSLADPEQGLPHFAQQHLPPWIGGAVFAGMLAALASTLDSLILVLSSSITIDLAVNRWQKIADRLRGLYPILSTVVAAILLGAVALNLKSNVFSLVLFAVSAVAGAFSASMLATIFRWRTSGAALASSMAAGLIVAVVWRVAGLSFIMLEALPGLCAGLLAHWLVVQFRPASAGLHAPAPNLVSAHRSISLSSDGMTDRNDLSGGA